MRLRDGGRKQNRKLGPFATEMGPTANSDLRIRLYFNSQHFTCSSILNCALQFPIGNCKRGVVPDVDLDIRKLAFILTSLGVTNARCRE